ncbi:sortase domain-containing protein [Streptomyces luteireticuli]|uniref:Class F sortase n=1 Tax=Streptomyces luteireticuli TaxID=173858 RepID=A0ABP3IFU2_9ACTN
MRDGRRHGCALLVLLLPAVAGLAALLLSFGRPGPAPPSPAPSGRPGGPDASAPVRVTAPAVGISARVVPLGLAPDGTVAVPPVEPDAPVGWYEGSPVPGAPGASVLLGHSTVGRYGEGAFFRLGELGPGQRVSVRRADGGTVAFTVRRVAEYPKADFPAGEVYAGASGPPRLRLVTCGGPHDPAGGYLDNIVVYADLTRGR